VLVPEREKSHGGLQRVIGTEYLAHKSNNGSSSRGPGFCMPGKGYLRCKIILRVAFYNSPMLLQSFVHSGLLGCAKCFLKWQEQLPNNKT
jgi:hypothetical protein